ncbi:MAG: YbaN family protein [Neomegalonema sp.]|nr:YbaN family protein [Neomegalonema sp.]
MPGAPRRSVKERAGSLFYLGLGWICVALGLLGVLLPLLPTTPFMIVAAFAFSRGSPRLHRWLLEHPRFGPPLQDWEQRGAIARPVKRLACVMMLATIALSALAGLPLYVLGIQAFCLSAAAAFVLTRPDA